MRKWLVMVLIAVAATYGTAAEAKHAPLRGQVAQPSSSQTPPPSAVEESALSDTLIIQAPEQPRKRAWMLWLGAGVVIGALGVLGVWHLHDKWQADRQLAARIQARFAARKEDAADSSGAAPKTAT